jgi:hypothetical protein
MKPVTVAKPTSARVLAYREYTLAPSTPINTNTVTSIVLRTWLKTSPALYPPPPQKLARNSSESNASAMNTTNTMIGTILAMVTTVLMNAASLMPRRIMKCTVQRMIEEQTTAAIVLPSPKIGKNRPSVDLIRIK